MTTPLALPTLRRYVRHGTLPQLAALAATVRLGSAGARGRRALHRAADDFRPAALADSPGVRVFEPRGKRLVPTAAALALVEASDEVSAALARCEQTLCAFRGERAAANDGRA